MERIGLGFRTLKENLWIGLIPLGLNLLAYISGIITKTLKLVPPGFHIKFSVPTSIPDISNILQQPQVQGFQINGDILSFIVFLLLEPFLAGGFYSSIFSILKGDTINKKMFLENCKYYFIRLFGANLLGFLLIMLSLIPTTLIHPLLGIVTIFFIIYLTFFWQMALVYHDLDIIEGFNKGREFFKTNFSETIGLLIMIAICVSVFSIPLNLLAQNLIGYGIAILIWSFVGTGFSIAVMSFFSELTDNNVYFPSV